MPIENSPVRLTTDQYEELHRECVAALRGALHSQPASRQVASETRALFSAVSAALKELGIDQPA